MLTVPASGRCAPVRIFTSVDLPAPFSPTSAWISAGRTSRDTSSSALIPPNCLWIRCAATSGPSKSSIGCSSVVPLLRQVDRRELLLREHGVGAHVEVVAVLRLVVALERRVEVPVRLQRRDVDQLRHLLALDRLVRGLDA